MGNVAILLYQRADDVFRPLSEYTCNDVADSKFHHWYAVYEG